MIVLDHDGESVVVNPEAGRGIPTETVSADVIPLRIETEKMAARKIIIIERAENDGGVRQHSRGGRGLVGHNAGARRIGGGINADGSAKEAGVWLVGDALGRDGQEDAAAVGQTILKRGLPFWREVRGVHGKQVACEIVEMRSADGVNRGAVG